jgi:hypothetical protein
MNAFASGTLAESVHSRQRLTLTNPALLLLFQLNDIRFVAVFFDDWR